MAQGKITVLGERYFTEGFMLAGVQDVFTVEKDAEQKLSQLIDSKEYSIIFISEKLGDQMDWRLKKKISNLAYPVVVALPDVAGESMEAANIRALIKRALGFDIVAKQ
ncbi:MAG: V-type ATP synthase subunit F [Candidatus ainarchaeum sp.]|nr:V-type ATP synthase subunit F [Candidatus ainarchaeum sp.]